MATNVVPLRSGDSRVVRLRADLTSSVAGLLNDGDAFLTTFHRELMAVSPDLAEALADRFASAKVLPMSVVAEFWPDLENRLKMDGSLAPVEDLSVLGESEGYELEGIALPRKERADVPPIMGEGSENLTSVVQ